MNTGRKDAVQVFQEGLLFDILIGEYKSCSFALDAARPVKDFEVLQKVADIVRAMNEKSTMISMANSLINSRMKGKFLTE